MKEILARGLDAMGIAAPAGAVEALALYGERLREKNTVMNLTAITEPEEMARLHFLDCAAVLGVADFAGKRVADVGCGAGFPGMPIKLLCPSVQLTELDSAGKKLDFVRATAEELGCEGVECLWGRAEEQTALRESFDIVVSRAVADYAVLAELCLPLVKVGGLFLAMKGPQCGEEVDAVNVGKLGARVLRTEIYTIPETDIVHSVVVAEKRAPTPAEFPRRYAQIKKKPLRK